VTARARGDADRAFPLLRHREFLRTALNYIGPGRSRSAVFLHARFESATGGASARNTEIWAYSHGAHRR